TFDVISTPGHSPDHVTYATGDAILSGDVLFQGSVGRIDLPGSDHATLMRSIATLLDTLPDDTHVLPGHMGPTTLGAERATNPFLRELAARHERRAARGRGQMGAAGGDRREDPRPRRLPPDRDADVRGDAPVQPDGGGGDRRRPE